MARQRVVQTDETQVDLAAVNRLELFGARHVEEVQRHQRVEFAERSERCRQQPIMDVGDVADIQTRVFLAAQALYVGDAVGAHRQHLPGIEKKQAPFRAESNPVVGPLQQAYPQFVFEVTHLSSQRRLGEAQVLCGLGEAKSLGDRNKIA